MIDGQIQIMDYGKLINLHLFVFSDVFVFGEQKKNKLKLKKILTISDLERTSKAGKIFFLFKLVIKN